MSEVPLYPPNPQAIYKLSYGVAPHVRLEGNIDMNLPYNPRYHRKIISIENFVGMKFTTQYVLY